MTFRSYLTLLITVVACSNDCLSEPVDLISYRNGQSTFSTKGHAKSKGLNITVPYPTSWAAKEGARPNIVQKFFGRVEDGLPMVQIIIKDVPQTSAGTDVAAEVFSDASLKDLVPPGSQFVDSGGTKYDAERGAWIIFYKEDELSTVKVRQYTLQHMVYYHGKLIVLPCSVGSSIMQKAALKAAFDSYLPLFRLIGAGIVLNDKWGS